MEFIIVSNAFSPVTKGSQIEPVLRELSPGLIFWTISLQLQYELGNLYNLYIHIYNTRSGRQSKLSARGAVRHLMNYRPRPPRCCGTTDELLPSAEGDSSSGGPQHLWTDSFYCGPEKYEIVVH